MTSSPGRSCERPLSTDARRSRASWFHSADTSGEASPCITLPRRSSSSARSSEDSSRASATSWSTVLMSIIYCRFHATGQVRRGVRAGQCLAKDAKGAKGSDNGAEPKRAARPPRPSGWPAPKYNNTRPDTVGSSEKLGHRVIFRILKARPLWFPFGSPLVPLWFGPRRLDWINCQFTARPRELVGPDPIGSSEYKYTRPLLSPCLSI
jgi:hypothetical protein